MPESPLIQIETNSLKDLEALIEDRAKRESDIELGFGRRRDREKKDYQANAQQLAEKFQLDDQTLKAEYKRKRQEVEARLPAGYQGHRGRLHPGQAAGRRPVPQGAAPGQEGQGRGRHAGADVLRGDARGGEEVAATTDANWSGAVQDLGIYQETAEVLFKRLGKMTAATDDEAAKIVADWEARIAAAPPPEAEPHADPEATDDPETSRAARPGRRQPADPPPHPDHPHRGGGRRAQRPEAPQARPDLHPHLPVPDPRRRGGRRAGHRSQHGLDGRRGRRRRRDHRRHDRRLDRPDRDGQAPGPDARRPAPQAPGRRRAGGRAEQGLGQDRFRAQAQGVRGAAVRQGPRGRGGHGPDHRRR